MYIDPGAGSIVIQVVIAVVIATTTSVTRFRRFVGRLFRRRREP
jgi:hypothetical protein